MINRIRFPLVKNRTFHTIQGGKKNNKKHVKIGRKLIKVGVNRPEYRFREVVQKIKMKV